MLAERGPGQDARWSTRSVAAGTVMSQAAISRIWRAYGPKPHLTQTWKLGSDPEFIGKVRDMADVYLGLPDSRPSTRCPFDRLDLSALPAYSRGLIEAARSRAARLAPGWAFTGPGQDRGARARASSRARGRPPTGWR